MTGSHPHVHAHDLDETRTPGIPRVGIGGPVGSGKTALIEALVPLLLEAGHRPLVVTNDVFTSEDVVLVESGGDNLTLTFSGALADYFIFVIDVAEGDKIPRKRGPGVTNSDLLVINKIDLAPYVRASLDVMDRDARAVRGERPFVLTNCVTGEGLAEVTNRIAHVIHRHRPAFTVSATT